MLNYEVVAQGLVRLTNWFGMHEIWDNGCAFMIGPIFEEAYEIRAAIIAGQVLGIGKSRDVAHAFCDRVMSTQGAVEEHMYYMGYGNQRNSEGVPNCSCIADAGSSAQILVEAVRAWPDSSKNEGYLKSLRAFADYVLDRYTTKDKVIGVGILGHQINPWPEYWCANSLFGSVLIGLGQITGEKKYLDAAVAPLEFLARFDYTNTVEKLWASCPTEVILYSSEAILEGLLSEAMKTRLSKTPNNIHIAAPVSPATELPADEALNRVKAESDSSTKSKKKTATLRGMLENRWNEYAEYLYRNQATDGTWWACNRDYSGYQMGLTWTILKACRELGTNPWLEKCAERQLALMAGREGKTLFGLFCRPFASALAHLSFAYAGQVCQQVDPVRFEKALHDAQEETSEVLW